MKKKSRVNHSFPPFFGPAPRILLLGSFPSVKSREEGFYYANPQNRFFPLLAAIYQESVPLGSEERKAFLARHGLALYDVVEECDIFGSSDSSIRNVKPANLCLLPSSITRIILNGKLAASLFERYEKAPVGVEVLALPSTSPANAAFSFEKLLALYRAALLK